MTEILTYRPACSIQPYIAGIDFEIMTPEEIKKYSAVQVTSGNIYSRNVPAACGMSDIRMGTCDRNLRCGSCGNSVRQCPGHCGHIELPQPMFHMAYMDHVLKLLRCTCFVCGEVRGNPPEPTKDSKATFNATYLACKSRRVCAHCGVNTVQVSKSGSGFRATVAPCDDPDVHEVLNRPLDPANVLDILEILTAQARRYLGLAHDWDPQTLVYNRILVPPPIVRPSVTNESKSRGQDDLTHKLQEVLKRSLALQSENVDPIAEQLRLNYDDAPVTEASERLQLEIGAIYNNTVRNRGRNAQRSGAPLKTIKARLIGKDGRLRGSILGKRTDASARSVISPDPEIDIHEVGVPEAVATTLTFPERVTCQNASDLAERVRRGAGVQGGAATVIMANGDVIDLAHCQDRDGLALKLRDDGTVVERHLQDGDHVIFNRQPSLHAASMMGHSVKILPGHTFRLNPIVRAVHFVINVACD
jgi:DNA-directed RNA polymerase II subunit RPB1